MNIFQVIFKARDKPKDALGGSRYNFFFGSTSAGRPINEHSVMQMTAVEEFCKEKGLPFTGRICKESGKMSEKCNQSCSSCGEDCADRKEAKKYFREKPHELSNNKKVIGVVSGKGGVGKSSERCAASDSLMYSLL